MTELEWMDEFAERLKDAMQSVHMNQSDLADAAGMSYSQISYYIRKERMPNVRSVLNISRALNCKVGELIDFTDELIL